MIRDLSIPFGHIGSDGIGACDEHREASERLYRSNARGHVEVVPCCVREVAS